MRLEDGCDFLVFVKLTHRKHALFDFRGMMCVVAQEDDTVVFDFEIEPTVYSSETGHSSFNLLGSHSVQVRQCHGSYAILYVDAYRNSQLDVIDTGVRCYKVNEYFSVTDADVLCVEVSFVT